MPYFISNTRAVLPGTQTKFLSAFRVMSLFLVSVSFLNACSTLASGTVETAKVEKTSEQTVQQVMTQVESIFQAENIILAQPPAVMIVHGIVVGKAPSGSRVTISATGPKPPVKVVVMVDSPVNQTLADSLAAQISP